MQLAPVIIGAIVYAGIVFLVGLFFIYFIRKFQDPEDLPDVCTKVVTV